MTTLTEGTMILEPKVDGTMVPIGDPPAPVPVVVNDPEVNADIEEARQTYKGLVKKGGEALEIAFDILEGSEHPRAVETFSGLMKSIADVTGKVVDLNQVKVDLATPKDVAPVGGTNQQQNNIFVGSTDDVIKLLNGGGNE